MVKYTRQADSYIKVGENEIAVFDSKKSKSNADRKVIEDFGEEWTKFANFELDEIKNFGQAYFNLIQATNLSQESIALDIGCGTGRWAYYISSKLKFVEAVDPSKAVISASKLLSDKKNTRVTQSELDYIPFSKESFDLVYSLGVLHHIPDTFKAAEKSASFVKPSGYLLLYLYYALDNRGSFFKLLFNIANIFRVLISRLPKGIKKIVCDVIAIIIYLPLIYFTKLLIRLFPSHSFWKKIPLAAYAEYNSSLNIVRNDALDRFGTRLEQRFSKEQILEIYHRLGFKNVRFSESAPFWVVIGQKK